MAAAPAPAREWEALLDLVEAQDRPAVTIAVAAQAVGARRQPADGVGMPSEADEAALRRACREEVEGRHRG
jgi:hypothetical protein